MLEIVSLKRAVVLLLVLASCAGKCAEGCIKCEGNNVCSICDASSLYVLSNGECVKQSLEFCLLSFNLFSCLKCYPGFYLELNGKCVKNPESINEIPFCKEYDSFTRCKTCKQFYYLTDERQKCERITGDVIENCVVYQDNTQCKTCGDYILSSNKLRCDPPEYSDPKCMFYSEKTSCTSCKEGYYYDKNYYIRHVVDYYQLLITSYKNYYMNQESTINVQVCEKKTLIENCLEPLGNHKCALCKEGFHINENYDQCIEDPPEAHFFRTDNITNCYLHNKTMVIRNNVPVLNIECILCYENYFKSVNNRKCMAHSKQVNNCKIMSQSTDQECILCENGYYRQDDPNSDEKCLARVDTNDNCLKYHLLSEACETCKDDTYIKHFEEKFCSESIQNCKIYETSGRKLSCKQCEFGFYYDTANGQCKPNDIFDPYCAYYNALKECQECYFGFYYDTARSEPTCQPNTPEYVEKARCTEFHPLNKNECIGCKSSASTIKLQYTCKAFPVDVTSKPEASNFIAFCDQYEITTSNNFKCKKPMDEVQHDNEDNKKVYVLITDEERAYNWTDIKLQYCDLHETEYKTVTDQILCKQCYKTRHIETQFNYDNVSNLSYCTENETDSGYCVKYFSDINTCRHYKYTNINKHNCPGFNSAKDSLRSFWNPFPSDDSVRAKACPWWDRHDYEINNCNISGDVRDYQCYSRDDQNNCNVFHFFQGGMTVEFKEFIEFEIVIAPDKTKCFQYNHFELENDANCVKASDDGEQCLLCRKDYYSIPTRTFTYELDSIESYISKTSDSNFVTGCIKFNNVRKLCERCAPNKYLSRNECISCDGNNLAIDYTGLSCLQFVDTNFPNTCKQISVSGTTTYCIQCRDGFVGKLNLDPSTILPKNFFPKIDGEQTMIEIESESLSFKECIDSNDLFYYDEDYKENINNCLFYQIYNDVTYCLGCKFGYTGEVYLTPNFFLTVQNCTTDSNCDLSVTYPLKDPYISSLVTCHKCTDASKIPTYNFFYTTAVNVAEPAFIYEHTSKKTMNCESPVISNCMIQITSEDETMIEKWNPSWSGNSSQTVCVYCKPKYKPTYTNTQEDFFPYRYITQCDFISDCESSLVPNQCEQCQGGGSADQNNKKLEINGEVSSCVSNDYVAQDPFCSKTSSDVASGICDECKDGYVYLNLKCIKLNVTNCKYFRGSTCVESTKELDEMKSIIWREYNSDYVIKTINCIEVETAIDKCEYYLSEDICHQCVEDWYVGNEGANCYERNVDNCIEYSDKSMLCVKCSPGFDVAGGSCVPAKTTTARGCDKFSDLYCATCLEENYYPIKIQLNQTSICLNATIHQFCEEIDEKLLNEEKILTCSKCKKMSDYETVATDDDFELSNYDFYDINTPDYADKNGLLMASSLWGHYSSVRSHFQSSGEFNPALRFAQFKYDYNVCQEYTSIENCLRYDDGSFEMTFNCIECTADYFLQNNSCEQRVPEAFCVEYYIDQNKCKRFVDTWIYSIKLSTFDNFVIANPPPKKSSSEIVDEGIEGCIAYHDTYTCRYCNSTTYLYDNLCLSVNTIVPQCEIYSRDGLCTKCTGELLLFQNKCLPKYSSNCDGFLSNTRCDRCPNGYPFLSSGSCIKNPDVSNCEEYANVSSCFFCDDAYSRDQTGQCELKTTYIDNCKKHLVGPFCSECEENYVLINNQCKLNPNYDRNCLVFEATSECNVCEFNYFFKEGQCYECKTDSFNCLFCDPDNPSKCALCKSGFFMNNEFNCVPIPGYTQPLIRLYQQSIVSQVSRLMMSLLFIWIMGLF